MAAVFRFRLETVLELRKRKERECALAMAECVREQQTCESHIREIVAQLSHLNDSIRKQRTDQGRSAQQFLQQEHYRHRLRRLMDENEARLTEIRQRVEQHRTELVAASQGVKALERLKERQRERFSLEQARKEAGILEEVAAVMHQRRQSQTADQSTPGGWRTFMSGASTG